MSDNQPGNSNGVTSGTTDDGGYRTADGTYLTPLMNGYADAIAGVAASSGSGSAGNRAASRRSPVRQRPPGSGRRP